MRCLASSLQTAGPVSSMRRRAEWLSLRASSVVESNGLRDMPDGSGIPRTLSPHLDSEVAGRRREGLERVGMLIPALGINWNRDSWHHSRMRDRQCA